MLDFVFIMPVIEQKRRRTIRLRTEARKESSAKHKAFVDPFDETVGDF